MKEICFRSHHVEMLNNIALLSDPEMAETVLQELRKTPLSKEGIKLLQQLASQYDGWNKINVQPTEGADDLCNLCDGFNPQLKQCAHYYSFDNPSLTPEQNRVKADKDILIRHPNLGFAHTLAELHRISIR